MKLRNKAILGASVLLGGSVLLYATVNQVINDKQQIANGETTVLQAPEDSSTEEQPLTADIQTEQNILAQKKKEREARVEAQERDAQKYLTEQQRIDAAALAKSRAENQLYVKEDEIARPVVTPRPMDTTNQVSQQPTQMLDVSPTDAEKKTTEEPTFHSVTPKTQQTSAKIIDNNQQVAEQRQKAQDDEKQRLLVKQREQQKIKQQAEKQLEKQKREQAQKQQEKSKQEKIENSKRPTTYQVQRGEGLIQLSRRYNVPVEALAQMNNLDKNSTLNIGQKINIPNDAQIKRLQREATEKEQKRQQEVIAKQKQAQAEAQQKQQYQTAQQKLKEARQTAKKTDAKGTFGVQVSLATDQKKADEIVKQLKSAGYSAKTSQTSRGVRVVVGPEKGKEAALALKDKINADPKLKANEAWVLYW